MYQKPAVQRLGSFRELTRQGCDKEYGSEDGYTFLGQVVRCHVS